MDLGIVVLGFLMLFVAWIGGVLLYPLLEKWREKSRDIAGDQHNIAHVKQMIEAKKLLERSKRDAGKFSDPRVEDLLAAKQYGQARQLVEEKLCSAHEQDNETLEHLYKQYLAQLNEVHPKQEG